METLEEFFKKRIALKLQIEKIVNNHSRFYLLENLLDLPLKEKCNYEYGGKYITRKFGHL